MSKQYLPWNEKYRPKTNKEIVQAPTIKSVIDNWIKTKTLTHTIFYGPSGTGKTSTAHAVGREIFGKYYSSRVKELNASDDRGISAVRGPISIVAKKYSCEIIEDGVKIPAFKIIILDEADAMTEEAQDAMRIIIEQYSGGVIFIFICNKISKITDAIKSRCCLMFFKKLSHDIMINRLKEISEIENMNLPTNILDTVIEVANGDMRKAITILQNLKYTHDLKNFWKKSILDMNKYQLKNFPFIVQNDNFSSNKSNEITIDDVYKSAITISHNQAEHIINSVLSCESLVNVKSLGKNLITSGYPIDNILFQLNKSILKSKIITTHQKAKIFVYSGKIFHKIKDSANDYIQMLDYLCCIYDTVKKQ